MSIIFASAVSNSMPRSTFRLSITPVSGRWQVLRLLQRRLDQAWVIAGGGNGCQERVVDFSYECVVFAAVANEDVAHALILRTFYRNVCSD